MSAKPLSKKRVVVTRAAVLENAAPTIVPRSAPRAEKSA